MEVEVHRSASFDALVRSDPVEDVAVVFGLGGECRPVGDVDAVESLVLERPEASFADAVLTG